MIDAVFRRGVELPGIGLWLDPWDPKPWAFVSHAHSDHIGRHARTIATPATAALMRARQGPAGDVLELGFGETRAFGGCALTLHPAGHVLGSAQCLVETADGTLVYTGDFKLRPGLSAEPFIAVRAETLVMETTYGLPKYRFPPTADTIAAMVEFCEEALGAGAVPVLLGYSLGKSQEILCALLSAGLTPMLHPSVEKMTALYATLRPGFPGGSVPFDRGAVAGRVLVCPPGATRSKALRGIGPTRTAMLTGWALDPSATFRYGCDAAFPLSDHADYDDLIRCVELVNPSRVLTLHGYAEEFARDLRARGIEAWALRGDGQMEFRLDEPRAVPKRADATKAAGPEEGFAALGALADAVRAAPSRSQKVRLLAEALRNLPPDDAAWAACFLAGKPAGLAAGVGPAAFREAAAKASGVGTARVRALARQLGDTASAARDLLEGRTTPVPWPLSDAGRFFGDLAAARGPSAKIGMLADRLGKLSAREGALLLAILSGDLRIGLKDGLLEEAAAEAWGAPPEAVRRAMMLEGDIGRVVRLAAEGKLAEARLVRFRPIQCMLASPEPAAAPLAARIAKAAAGPFFAEDKLDGVRAQLHCGGGRAECFSRDLKPLSAAFPEIVRAAVEQRLEGVFDGEIVASAAGKSLTFFDLQRRLGRRGDDFFLGAEVPVRFLAFDALELHGEPLLDAPLAYRRRLLAEVPFAGLLGRVEGREVLTEADIEAAFAAARARGSEGLVVKDPSSAYQPGRRGFAWLKFKKALETLDVVVVGAERGHGKRRDVLSDYTFAVRGEDGRLMVIGKAYSGLTDEEIEELTAHFIATTVAERGRYREVRPEVVLEIAFDAIRPSARHPSGLALRFPRIKAIRRDKTPQDADTLETARRIAGLAPARQ